ncbi:hypothetical protein [Arthrobacter sp. ok909]|uniref:hypothetical protein n=1 Tax=Arthrobacter sp. ok909 TaxID=1761746 RepID=UPI0020C8582D|nr:hypothetical protein [Arthrobacter sp. ok909]
MDFPLSSSVILVIAVALWIVWVAPYVLRNGRHQLQPAGEFLADVIDIEPVDPQAGKVMKMAAQQEKPMNITRRAEPVGGTAGPGETPTETRGASPLAAAASPAFRIRWGRLMLALAGMLSLLTGVVSALLRLFGVGSGWLPVAALVGAVASVAVLRRLAVRDRRRKMNAAFRAAMGSPAHRPVRKSVPDETPSLPAERPGVRPESPLFDAEADRSTPEPSPKPLTALDLRQAALAEAAASGDTAAAVAVASTAPAEGASWEPVDVPKPTYVEAPKAERAAPKPLDLPQAPKAVGKPSLKQASARPAGSDPRIADDPETKQLSKAQSALSNLDDVLQRRRA